MKPNDIRAELVRRGVSAPQIARRLGVSNQTILNVISGKSQNPQARQEIALTIQTPLDQVFEGETKP